MRIGLIGDFTEPLDEGQKAIAHYLARELSRDFEITKFNVTALFTPKFWSHIRNTKLHLIHYIPGPSIKSLAVCKLIAVYHDAKMIVSAPQPTFSTISEKLIPSLRPDLVLVQSKRWEKWFVDQGCKTSFVPNGVDTDKFKPVSTRRRGELRKKFGVNGDRFLILHVGHITHRRNVQFLTKIQGNGKQVLMVSSKYFKADNGLLQSLKSSGCIVLEGHIPNLEQIYAMSDCYLFPPKPGNTVLTPLSVLEAMACNLPVVSTRFEGLVETFEEGDGLFFADSDADMIRMVEGLESNINNPQTRKKVMPYSWSQVAKQVGQLYQHLLAKG